MRVETKSFVIVVSDDVGTIRVRLNRSSVTIHTEWNVSVDGNKYRNMAKNIAGRFREIAKIKDFNKAFDILGFELKHLWSTDHEQRMGR